MKKRVLSVLLALSMALSLLPGSALAAEEEADAGAEPAGETAAEPEEPATEGSCGEDLTWSLDTLNGILTISGAGEMYDYAAPAAEGGEAPAAASEDGEAPWNPVAQSIQTVAIGEGVTALGENAFAACGALTDIYYYGTDAQWAALDTANLSLAPLDVTTSSGLCTITFEPGNSGEAKTVLVAPNELYVLPMCDFEAAAGTAFKAWLVGGDTVTEYRAGCYYTFTGDTTVTAKWMNVTDSPAATPKIQYTGVTTEGDNEYNLQNNGNYTVSSSKQVLPIHYPIRPGHTFDGWVCSQSGVDTSNKSVTLPANYSSDLTLRATWKAIPYVIRVWDATETTPLTNEETYSISAEVQRKTMTPTPPRKGHSLQLQFVPGTSGNGVTFDGATVIIPAHTTGDINLIGTWVPKTFTIDYQLGEGGTQTGVYLPSFQYSETDPVKFTLADPVRPDYDFAGWDCNYSTVTVPARKDGDTSTEITVPADFDTDQTDGHGDEIPLTLTARWTPHVYKVTYDLGEGNPDAGYPEKTYTVDDFTDGTLCWELDDPVWAGHIFREWTCGDAKVKLDPYRAAPDTSITRVTLEGTGDFTFTAHWDDVYYNVTFAPNGGQGNMAATKVKYGEEYIFPACTIRPQSGMEFDYWTVTVGGQEKTPQTRTDENGKTVYYCVFTEDATDVVFTAHWKDKTYKVTFSNGLAGSDKQEWADPASYSHSDMYTVPDWSEAARLGGNIQLPPGREFDAWSVSTNGRTQDRKPGDSFRIVDDVAVTAKWRLLDYTLVFDPGEYADDPFYTPSELPPREGVHIDTTLQLPGGYTLTLKPLTPADPDDPDSVPEPPEKKAFKGWEINGALYSPGSTLPVNGNLVYGIQPDTAGRRVIPVHAVWDDASNQTTVTYAAGYGGSAMATYDFSVFPGVTINLPAFAEYFGGQELPGMRFKAWRVEETAILDSGASASPTTHEMNPGDAYLVPAPAAGQKSVEVRITAVWEGDVAYDLNGGTYGESDPNNPAVYIYSDAAQELPPLTPPARAGYIFVGWTCDNAAVDIQDSYVVLPGGFSGTLALKANWDKDSDTCVVTYSPGSGAGDEFVQEVAKNTTITLPECAFTAPVGQMFKAWSVNGQEHAPGDTITVVDDLRVIAIWEDDPNASAFTVTILPGEGGGQAVSQTCAKGESVTLQSWSDYGFTAPAGKEFDYWDVNGTPAAAGSTHTVDRTLVITAVWKATAQAVYTVTYDPGEGTGTPVVVENVPAGSYALQTWQSCNFTAPEGKEFDCWSVDGTRVSGTGYNISADTTFTALWKDKSDEPDEPDNPPPADVWTVTFDPNGGSGSMAPVSVAKGQLYTLPACAFTPPQGREFKAWLVNGQEYAPGASVNIVSNTVVTAVWQAAGAYLPPGTYAINYWLSGGASRRLQTSYTVSVRDQVLNLIDPVKEGHTFLGWTYEGQVEPVYTVVIPAGFTGELLLTAVWEKDGAASSANSGSDTTLPSVPAVQYADVAADAWYYEAVAYVSSRGLMTGTSSAAFSPDGTMSRAMLWTVLARMGGGNVSGGATWYEGSMKWVQANGISDGAWPNSIVTREELVTLLWRYAGSPRATNILRRFSDGMTVSDYAAEAVSWAAANGILNGSSGSLNPQKQATRAEVASVLMRFLQYRAA